jgi:hypothetical protein
LWEISRHAPNVKAPRDRAAPDDRLCPSEDVDSRNQPLVTIVAPGFVLERGKRIGFIACGRAGVAANNLHDDFVAVFPDLEAAIAVLRLIARAVASRRGLRLVADAAEQSIGTLAGRQHDIVEGGRK